MGAKYRQTPFFLNGWLCLGALAVWSCLVSCERGIESSHVNGGETFQAEEKSGDALPGKVTFNAHIQPILSEKCYLCHGPDAGTREPKKSPLRLDSDEFAFEERGNGSPVIIKGKPEESLMIQLMKETDPEKRMPPPKSHKTLSEREIALVAKWIEQGAEYEPHWAFIPPKPPALPQVQRQDWVANPIDAFTLAKMEEVGLSPNPEQASHRLLRRIYFDVIGLPPTPREVIGFVQAHAKDPEQAIHDVLDRLFQSPAYGEQQARLWLDAARYADTHGIHIDNYREIWPYRDWVIGSFNQNMPFDQFTVEQLAGDMLPQATLDQKIATGFNRCLPTTGEGGSIAEEVLAMYATDRVNTTFGVWQGLTVGCAECHDHKFDPISQKDFYQIAAFFRNTTMSALDKNNGKHPPNIFVPKLEDRDSFYRLDKDIWELEKITEAEKRDKSKNVNNNLKSGC